MSTMMYIIDQETMGIVPHYDSFGNLHTQVLLPEKRVTVGTSPAKLIDGTLRTQGTSFRGARDGANYILSRRHNTPVHIRGKESVILFPTTSPFREDCLWFALSHIQQYEAVGKGVTCVSLTNDQKIEAPVSRSSFDNQFQKALRFKYQLLDRPDAGPFLIGEPKTRYYLIKRIGKRNYENHEKGENEELQ